MGRRELALSRGDVVLVAEGKPRPAVIVQSDRLPTPDATIICPLTSFLTDAPIYRPTIMPSAANGLLVPSQLMLDRINPARWSRIDRRIGRLPDDDLERLNNALAILLDLIN